MRDYLILLERKSMNNLITYKGTMSKKDFNKYMVRCYIFMFVYGIFGAIAFGMGLALAEIELESTVGSVLEVLFLIPLFSTVYFQYAWMARRLRDLGRPAWHFLLLFVPIYNIYLFLVLCLKNGVTPETNQPPTRLSA